MAKRPLLTEAEKRARRRAKSAKWRKANIEKSREIVRLSMKKAAAERALAAGRIPGKKGKPKVRTEAQRKANRARLSREYYARNRDAVLEQAKAREKSKRRGTHVSKALPRLTAEQRRIVEVVNGQNRRARLRNNGGKHMRQDIENLIVSQNGCCAMCRVSFGEDGYHVDHVIPLAAGGSNGRENIQLLHPTCNLKKGAMIAPDATHLASC